MNRSDGDGPETSTWVVGKLSCRAPPRARRSHAFSPRTRNEPDAKLKQMLAKQEESTKKEASSTRNEPMNRQEEHPRIDLPVPA